MTIIEFRQKYPQYNDLDNATLAAAIHAKHYPDMDKNEFNRHFIGNPNHEDLSNAAVTGQDSLELQDLDPTIKPAVKMTYDEYQGPEPGKITFILEDGTTYIVSLQTVDPVEALQAVLSGDDSKLLGYPAKGDEHAAVTKQGDIITDLAEMQQHAENGNVQWAANGNADELMDKASKVAAAVANKTTIRTTED